MLIAFRIHRAAAERTNEKKNSAHEMKWNETRKWCSQNKFFFSLFFQFACFVPFHRQSQHKPLYRYDRRTARIVLKIYRITYDKTIYDKKKHVENKYSLLGKTKLFLYAMDSKQQLTEKERRDKPI